MQRLKEKYPNAKMVLAAGDAVADVPLIQSVTSGGLALIVGGRKSRLSEGLLQGYALHDSFEEYENDTREQVALCLSREKRKSGKGNSTMADVSEHLDSLLQA